MHSGAGLNCNMTAWQSSCALQGLIKASDTAIKLL